MADEKLKILYLMKILLEETDRDHILNAVELCEMLDLRYEMPANRKAIYGDVERLRSFGLDVVQVKGKHQGYYVGEREFELPELKLLVDAVQSSKFITGKKSDALIRKLEKLTTRENARQLHRQVVIYNRAKSGNETVFANVDVLHSAMQQNRQITFQYCEWNTQKQLVPRKGGELYRVSPWALTWDDENYYLVAYDAAEDRIKHYRVDKMQSMSVDAQERDGRENFRNFDLAAFAKKTFGMFGGTEANVSLQCENNLIGVIIDRFGTGVTVVKADDTHFRVHVPVVVSPQFFGWAAGIGRRLQIIGPDWVAAAYREYLEDILANFGTDSAIS